jgi:hypothetical protein
MGRTKIGRIKIELASAAGLALLVISIVISTPGFAQEAAQKPAASAKEIHIWSKVVDGIWVAKVPRFSDKEELKPEFAVFRLSAARYEEFEKNPKDFLNDHKTFSRPVNKVETCQTPLKPDPKVDYWYVVVPHWPGSTALCQAYPGGTEPK